MKKKPRQLDDVDKQIIFALQKDARTPFKLIARQLGVSEGTVSNRYNRLMKDGILKLEAKIDPFALSNKVTALVGVTLKERTTDETMGKIMAIEGVNCVWNATGRYDLFFELMTDSLSEMNDILFRENLDGFSDIDHTETFVTLSGINKYYTLY